MIAFTVFGTPIPKGSTRAFYVKKLGRAVITAANSKTKPWAQAITATALAERAAAALDGPIAVRLMFYLPRPKSLPRKALAAVRKPDVDKLARCVLDSLTGVFWQDDAQVVELLATKAYAGDVNDPGGVPRVDVFVNESVDAVFVPREKGE